MFELGENSFEEHQKIVELASSYPEVEIYFVGKHFFQTKKEINHIQKQRNFIPIKRKMHLQMNRISKKITTLHLK